MGVYMEDTDEFDAVKDSILKEYGDQEEKHLLVDIADQFYDDLVLRSGEDKPKVSASPAPGITKVNVVGAKLGVGSIGGQPVRVGTATCFARSKPHNSRIILTSAHFFAKHPEVFLASQTANSILLGKTIAKQEDAEIDAGLVEIASEDTLAYNKTEDGLEIHGVLKESQLPLIFGGADKITRRRVRIVGANSGYLYGRVLKCAYTIRIRGSSQLLVKNHIRISGAYCRFGDSGAAVVWTDPESKKNYIVGILRGSLQMEGYVYEDATVCTFADKVFEAFELAWEN